MGANLISRGATFRVWAPNATAVHVRGSFNGFAIRDDASLVRVDPGYWHGFVDGIGDGATYKYWVTGPTGPGWKRDPYARELQEPNWDCVVRGRAIFRGTTPASKHRPSTTSSSINCTSARSYTPRFPESRHVPRRHRQDSRISWTSA